MKCGDNKYQGIFFVALAAICWGLIGLFVRALNEVGYSSIQIVALRACGASLLLGLYFSIFDRKAFRIKRKDIWIFLGTGLGSMVFFNFCYFGSIRRTSLAVAAALLYTAPAFVGILSRVFLGERLTKNGLVGIILAIFGCMMTSGIFTHLKVIDVPGLLLGLGSGLGYALYSIFGKFAIARGYKSQTSTFYTFLIAMICTSFSLISRRENTAIHRLGVMSGKLLVSLGGLIVISTVMAYILYTKGLENIDAGMASVVASIEPVVATIISVALFGESISWNTAVGLICILSSTVVVAIPHKG